jgi:hypothetical protein
LVNVDVVGERDGVFRWKDEFARPSPESEREGFLADAEIFHAGAESEDFAGAFVADRGRKRGEFAIGSLDDIEVGWIDGRGEHSEHDLAGSGCGRGEGFDTDGGRFFPKGKKSTSQRHDRMVSHRAA